MAGYPPGANCWKPLDVGRDYVVFLPGRTGDETAWFGTFTTAVPEAEISGALRRRSGLDR